MKEMMMLVLDQRCDECGRGAVERARRESRWRKCRQHVRRAIEGPQIECASLGGAFGTYCDPGILGSTVRKFRNINLRQLTFCQISSNFTGQLVIGLAAIAYRLILQLAYLSLSLVVGDMYASVASRT